MEEEEESGGLSSVAYDLTLDREGDCTVFCILSPMFNDSGPWESVE